MHHKFLFNSASTRKTIKAAENGDAAAMFELGLAYMVGNGVKASPEQAIYWLKEAADKGVSNAYAVIGDIYADKSLGLFDMDKALDSYIIGVMHGSHDALLELSTIYISEYNADKTAEMRGKILNLSEQAKALGEIDVAIDLENTLNS